MKPYLTISIILHFIIVAGLIISSRANSSENKYPEIYRVNIIGSSPPPPPQKAVTTVERSRHVKQVVKQDPKPEGLSVQQKTKNQTRTPKQQTKSAQVESKQKNGSQQGSNYPTFLDDIDFGSEFGGVKIDGANFQSSYYVNLVFAKIRSRWINPVRLGKTIETTIYFKVESNGRISDAQIESPSGIETFDQSALRSVLKSDPLPPLPQEFTGDNIGIHLKFEYTP